MSPRYLRGVIPSALLEAYAFWEGADGVLRGSPHDEESQWFAAKVELHLVEGKVTAPAGARERD